MSNASYSLNFGSVFLAAINDFEGFYDCEPPFKVKYKLCEDALSNQHASIIGSQENAYVRFSSDCCNKELESITDCFVALIIVCHELAHYVNHHNYYASPELEDSRIIEAWADRFGMCIFMCLITYGEKSKKIAESMGMPVDSGERLNEIGKAFGYMFKWIYNDSSKKYHIRGDRVMHVAAGVNSFLEAYWGTIDVSMAISVYRRIYIASDIMEGVNEDINSGKYSEDDWDKIRTIHISLQNGRDAITLGLKKEYRKYIDTSYVESKTASSAYKKLRYLLAAQQATMSGLDASTQEYLVGKFLESFREDLS
ncbi:hypothetical protein TUM17576_50340 [Enterobacter hormaechei]|nr:hypothetical protein [Enterobacter hormaechei]GJL38214.1 hypothetical protein TUM17576_50340 [Enterobacter hormaechei]